MAIPWSFRYGDMMSRWFPSDQQFLDRIRRGQRQRRLWGVIYLIVGVYSWAPCFYWYYSIRKQMLSFPELLTPMTQPTMQQQQVVVDNFKFYMGFLSGMLVAGGLLVGIMFAVIGVLQLVLRNRKDQMLLRLWDAQPPTS